MLPGTHYICEEYLPTNQQSRPYQPRRSITPGACPYYVGHPGKLCDRCAQDWAAHYGPPVKKPKQK